MEKLNIKAAETVLRFWDKLGKRQILHIYPLNRPPLILEQGDTVKAEWYNGCLFTMTCSDETPTFGPLNLSIQFIVVDRRKTVETPPFQIVYPVKWKNDKENQVACEIYKNATHTFLDKKLQKVCARLAAKWLALLVTMGYLKNHARIEQPITPFQY